MKLVFSEQAGADYLYWQKVDKKLRERSNALVKDMSRSPFAGIDKPEPLKNALSGYWSRRINDEHRIVYTSGPPSTGPKGEWLVKLREANAS